MNVPTAHVLTTAKWIGRLAYAIAFIGVIASYGTQVELLNAYGVGVFSYVIPATIDLLAVCAALALQLPGLDLTSRKIAGATLTVAVGVSVGANVIGAHNNIARLAHAWPVVAYLLGELLANRVRTFAVKLVAAEAAVEAAEVVEAAPVAIQAAPVAALPVEAAPVCDDADDALTAGPRRQYGPRNGVEYSKRHLARLAKLAERAEPAGVAA